MKRTYFTIFFVSCSALMFEISLTRVFAVSLWYHFAFVVISIAMLGVGSAGTVLAMHSLAPYGTDKRPRWLYPESHISVCALLTGIAITVCYLISNAIPFDPVTFQWDRAQFFYLALYCLVLSIPFFFSGLVIAAAFSVHSEHAMSVYCADLLGAGLGSVSVIAVLNTTSPENAILSASLLCLAGAAAAGNKAIKVSSLICCIITLSIFLMLPDAVSVKISPYKSLPLYLQHPGSEHLNTYYSSYARIDTFRSPAVRFAPGLSLTYLAPLPEQTGFSTDGGNINAVTDAGDDKSLKFLEFLPSSLSYELGGKTDVMVIDPKGGLQVLMAEHYDAGNIVKVESNPMTTKIIKKDFGALYGGIYDENTHTGYGRIFLKRLWAEDAPVRSFDLIDISTTEAGVSGTFGIFEDYRFTEEAFVTYLRALKEEGLLSISTYLIPPPRTEFRILATVVSALETLDGRDASSRIAAIRSWDTMSILVKKSAFMPVEISRIRSFCKSRRFDPVYYPGITEDESNRYVKLPEDEYFRGFRKILDRNTRRTFLDTYLFDISPVHDNNPFYHYYLKFHNIKAIYEKMGQKWLYFIEEGYLLPVILTIVVSCSVILILLPVLYYEKKSRQTDSSAPRKSRTFSSAYVFIYFSMLGLGFMFVEVAVMQNSILLLENPSYSIAAVLTSILISSGTGSMLSSKIPESRTAYSLIIVSALILLYSVIHPLVLNILMPCALAVRIAALAALIMPLGLCMGIPFPLGIKVLGQKYREIIPWAWAINACFSVTAPLLTIMLALVIGFKAVLWIGAASYLTAFYSFTKFHRR